MLLSAFGNAMAHVNDIARRNSISFLDRTSNSARLASRLPPIQLWWPVVMWLPHANQPYPSLGSSHNPEERIRSNGFVDIVWILKTITEEAEAKISTGLFLNFHHFVAFRLSSIYCAIQLKMSRLLWYESTNKRPEGLLPGFGSTGPLLDCKFFRQADTDKGSEGQTHRQYCLVCAAHVDEPREVPVIWSVI